ESSPVMSGFDFPIRRIGGSLESGLKKTRQVGLSVISNGMGKGVVHVASDSLKQSRFVGQVRNLPHKSWEEKQNDGSYGRFEQAMKLARSRSETNSFESKVKACRPGAAHIIDSPAE